MVVATHHVLGPEVQEGANGWAVDRLDELRVARGHAMRGGGCWQRKHQERRECAAHHAAENDRRHHAAHFAPRGAMAGTIRISSASRSSSVSP
jgi:hypothetical protein